MLSAQKNEALEVTVTLLNAGADVNAKDNDGVTPLMLAALANRNPEVVAALLKAGADAKVKDTKGLTALDYAQLNACLRGSDVYGALQKASQ